MKYMCICIWVEGAEGQCIVCVAEGTAVQASAGVQPVLFRASLAGPRSHDPIFHWSREFAKGCGFTGRRGMFWKVHM